MTNCDTSIWSEVVVSIFMQNIEYREYSVVISVTEIRYWIYQIKTDKHNTQYIDGVVELWSNAIKGCCCSVLLYLMICLTAFAYSDILINRFTQTYTHDYDRPFALDTNPNHSDIPYLHIHIYTVRIINGNRGIETFNKIKLSQDRYKLPVSDILHLLLFLQPYIPVWVQTCYLLQDHLSQTYFTQFRPSIS